MREGRPRTKLPTKTNLIGSVLESRPLAPITSLVYKWYTHHLMGEVRSSPMPRHVAMILDDNRRFAEQYRLPDPTDGHRYGVDKVSEAVLWCNELEIPVVTLWALSTDNLERSPDELSNLFEIVRDRLEILGRDERSNPNRRRVRAVGRLDVLPEELRRQIADVKRRTQSAGPDLLNIAVAYGGRDEVLDRRQTNVARSIFGGRERSGDRRAAYKRRPGAIPLRSGCARA